MFLGSFLGFVPSQTVRTSFFSTLSLSHLRCSKPFVAQRLGLQKASGEVQLLGASGAHDATEPRLAAAAAGWGVGVRPFWKRVLMSLLVFVVV